MSKPIARVGDFREIREGRRHYRYGFQYRLVKNHSVAAYPTTKAPLLPCASKNDATP